MDNEESSKLSPSGSGHNDFVESEIQEQLLAEYNALRAEVIHRMGARHQIVVLTVAVLGAILAFDAPLNTLLAYPILGFFLALGLAHNDFRIGEIGEYVRTRIETKLPGLNWETHFYVTKKKEQPLRYILRASILSAGGLIVGSQILALIVPIWRQSLSYSNWCLAGIDLVAIIGTAVVLHWRKWVYHKKGPRK